MTNERHSPVSTDLTGCRVLIVGGSSGIGRAMALSSIKAGAEVVVVGRSPEKLAEVVESAGRGRAIRADVRDPGQCVGLVEEAAESLGQFDVVVMAAGVSCLMPLDRLDPATFNDTFVTNAVAPAVVAGAAAEHLAQHGVMLFLSSISSGGDYKGLGPYAASKAALDRLVRAFQFEHPELRSVCVAVGDTLGTDIIRTYDDELMAEVLPQWLASGSMYANQMEAVDLGQMLTEFVGMLMSHPLITISQVTVVPPGPRMAPNTDVVGDFGNAGS